MMDVDSTSLPLPPRLPGRVITTPNNNPTSAVTTAIELSAASRSSFLAGKMLRGADGVPVQPRSYGGKEDATTPTTTATSSRHGGRPVNAFHGAGRGTGTMASHGYDGVQEAAAVVLLHVPAGKKDRDSPRKKNDQSRSSGQQQLQIPPSSNTNSQDTTGSTANDTVADDDIFTPAASSGGGLSRTNSKSSGRDPSSQESQQLQLSQITAATRDKMLNATTTTTTTAATVEGGGDGGNDRKAAGFHSRKRMADGVVKIAVPAGSNASPAPLRGGHSRNTSTVSVASSVGSRLGELSAELKTRLSYAMVKVNNGWQSHTIDQVETLASQAASPTSSNSTTIHFRQGASASPQLSTSSHRGSNNATPAAGPHHLSRTPLPSRSSNSSSAAAPKQQPSLAPPITMEPSQQQHPRRTATNQRHTPSLGGGHSPLASPSTTAAPHTPGHQPSPYPGGAEQHQRTPAAADPMVFSPHQQTPQQQNVREQDAMEALLFMSSPGNSANLKHTFPSSSQPQPQPRPRPQQRSNRTALPSSQPRKSLPSGRPTQNPIPHPYGPASQPIKRVGFESSGGTGGAMDVVVVVVDDDHHHPSSSSSPYSRGGGGTKRRPLPNANGAGAAANEAAGGRNATATTPAARLKQLPLSAGLSGPSRAPRPRLADEDIDRMLDSVAADDSSDSEGEIVIPVRPQRREEVPAAAR